MIVRLERNDSPPVSYGLIGCLEQPHHAKAGMPIIGWRLVVGDAIDEMLELSLERFSAIHFRRPHITGTVAYKQVVDTLPIREVHTLVINPNFLVRFEIVPDQHLVLATKQGCTDFYWG